MNASTARAALQKILSPNGCYQGRRTTLTNGQLPGVSATMIAQLADAGYVRLTVKSRRAWMGTKVTWLTVTAAGAKAAQWK